MNREVNVSDIDKWFLEMIAKRLISTRSTWIEQAVIQKHPKMTLDLAHSVPLAYHDLDKAIIQREILN